jgi:hypothetical protein
MSAFASMPRWLAGGVLTGFACAMLAAGAAAQQKAPPPDFSSNGVGWQTFDTDFSVVPGGTSPMRDDPAHRRVSNQEAPGPASNRPTSSPI